MSLSLIILKYRNFLLPLLGVFLVFLSFQFVLPKWNEIGKAKEALKSQKEKLDLMLAKEKELASLNEYELSERAKIALAAVPLEKNPVLVMSLISSLAQEKVLGLKKISVSPGKLSPQEARKEEEDQSLSFRMEVVGPFGQIKEFLGALDEALPLMETGVLKVSLSGDETTLNFTVKSYFLFLPETLGKMETPLPKLTVEQEKVLTKLSQSASLSPLPALPPSSVGGKTNPFAF